MTPAPLYAIAPPDSIFSASSASFSSYTLPNSLLLYILVSSTLFLMALWGIFGTRLGVKASNKFAREILKDPEIKMLRAIESLGKIGLGRDGKWILDRCANSALNKGGASVAPSEKESGPDDGIGATHPLWDPLSVSPPTLPSGVVSSDYTSESNARRRIILSHLHQAVSNPRDNIGEIVDTPPPLLSISSLSLKRLIHGYHGPSIFHFVGAPGGVFLGCARFTPRNYISEGGGLEFSVICHSLLLTLAITGGVYTTICGSYTYPQFAGGPSTLSPLSPSAFFFLMCSSSACCCCACARASRRRW